MTAHVVPVPEQPPPLQPENVESAAGLALRVTAVPLGKLPEQVAPQAIPAGALVTVPLPVPALLTASVTGCRAKVAVTGVAGPDGGSPAKPVGLTYIAVADAIGVAVRRHL